MVKTLSRTITLWVTRAATCRDVKHAVSQETGWKLDEFQVVYSGRQISESVKLQRCGISPGSTLHAVGRLRGGTRTSESETCSNHVREGGPSWATTSVSEDEAESRLSATGTDRMDLPDYEEQFQELLASTQELYHGEDILHVQEVLKRCKHVLMKNGLLDPRIIVRITAEERRAMDLKMGDENLLKDLAERIICNQHTADVEDTDSEPDNSEPAAKRQHTDLKPTSQQRQCPDGSVIMSIQELEAILGTTSWSGTGQLMATGT